MTASGAKRSSLTTQANIRFRGFASRRRTGGKPPISVGEHPPPSCQEADLLRVRKGSTATCTMCRVFNRITDTRDGSQQGPRRVDCRQSAFRKQRQRIGHSFISAAGLSHFYSANPNLLNHINYRTSKIKNYNAYQRPCKISEDFIYFSLSP